MGPREIEGAGDFGQAEIARPGEAGETAGEEGRKKESKFDSAESGSVRLSRKAVFDSAESGSDLAFSRSR